MMLKKTDPVTRQCTFVIELPAGYDDRTRMLEFHEHLLIVHPMMEPLCVDKLTCERVELSTQKQIEARWLAAHCLGEVGRAIH